VEREEGEKGSRDLRRIPEEVKACGRLVGRLGKKLENPGGFQGQQDSLMEKKS